MWTFVWFSLGQPSTEEPHSVFEMPSSAIGRCVFVVSVPIKVLLYLTVPDCRHTRWRKWVIVTFILSLVWLSLFSYLMVWMITIIGKDLLLSLFPSLSPFLSPPLFFLSHLSSLSHPSLLSLFSLSSLSLSLSLSLSKIPATLFIVDLYKHCSFFVTWLWSDDWFSSVKFQEISELTLS